MIKCRLFPLNMNGSNFKISNSQKIWRIKKESTIQLKLCQKISQQKFRVKKSKTHVFDWKWLTGDNISFLPKSTDTGLASVQAAVIDKISLWNFVERCPGASYACVYRP